MKYSRLIILIAKTFGIAPATARDWAETGAISLEEALELYVLEDCLSAGRLTWWMDRETELKQDDIVEKMKGLAGQMRLATTGEEREEIAKQMRELNRRK